MQRQAQSSGQGAPTAPPSVLSSYRPAADAFDEQRSAVGATRLAWESFSRQIDRIGFDELGRRWTNSQRLIYENGVAYSAYGDPEERPRPWALDPIPLLMHESEWAAIAEGLRQRARLMELVLQDLYGPQRLVHSGVFPAEALYRHPSYRAALHREPAHGDPGPMLFLYAADLGRSSDGQWWVLADRTEAPSGVGFALENRIVTSRMLAEPFRDRRVRRLAPFFARLRDAMRRGSPNERANPTVAILSQGARHPNYFEDAYLAKYLGYTIVEGGDLTVRDRSLWMKTLEGLSPIDVLLRRPNTSEVDPLELGGESPAGIAGLLQAVRRQSVLVANACGSGLVESPIFMAFMPQLCQAVLGEPLKMPGAASWWCGDPESLEFVLANLDRLILKRAYRRRGRESLLLPRAEDVTPETLAELIRQKPFAFVAQEEVTRSTAPAWTDDGSMAPVRVALRAFAISGEDEHHVMDGALARTICGKLEPLEVSARTGEGSKDVWIVGDRSPPPFSLLPSEQEPIRLVRVGGELPSRVADNSYWLGRYLERADAAARLLRSVATRLTDEDEPEAFPELPGLLRGLAELGQIEAGHAVEGLRGALPRLEGALPRESLDPQQVGSLSATVRLFFSVARNVRDRLSRDAWRIVLRINERFRSQSAEAADLTELLNLTDELVLDLAALGGMVVESMTHTQFYRFLDIGRRVERAMQSVELLRATLIESPAPPGALLEALLESSDSVMTYRARYRQSVELAPVLDLLLTDESNPRSLAFCLYTLERHVGKLPRNAEASDNVDAPEQRLALGLSHAVRMVDVTRLAEAYEVGDLTPLAALLDIVGGDLPRLANTIAHKYLTHSGPAKQLAPI